MAWAMLPGLMSLTRIECLRWDGNGDRTGGSCFGGRRRDPSERRAPPTTCCCQSLGSQISALTVSSRGSGWPASWCRRAPSRIRALQMTAGGQPAPVPAENLIRAACGMLVLMKHAAGGRDRKQFTRLPAHCAHHVAVADATRGVDPAHAVRHLRWGRRVVGRARQRQRDRHRPTASAATASQPAGRRDQRHRQPLSHGRRLHGGAQMARMPRACSSGARACSSGTVLREISPIFVSEGGLEPPCPFGALAPQASASANSATRTWGPACKLSRPHDSKCGHLPATSRASLLAQDRYPAQESDQGHDPEPPGAAAVKSSGQQHDKDQHARGEHARLPSGAAENQDGPDGPGRIGRWPGSRRLRIHGVSRYAGRDCEAGQKVQR